MAGGALGVFGLLAVLFENGVAAAGPAIVGGLDRIQATVVLDRIHSAAAITALGPLAITGDIGLALLGIAAVKAGAPRWAAQRSSPARSPREPASRPAPKPW